MTLHPAAGPPRAGGGRNWYYPQRAALIRLFLALASLGLVVHVILIQTVWWEDYVQSGAVPADKQHEVRGNRGAIVDHLFRPLAISLSAVDVATSPPAFRHMLFPHHSDLANDPAAMRASTRLQDVARNIACDLGVSFQETLDRLCSTRKNVMLARRVDADRAERLRARGSQDPCYRGLYFDYTERREYPCGHLASAVLGYCDAAQTPRGGVEWSLRQVTEGQRATVGLVQVRGGRRRPGGQLGEMERPPAGNDLILTLDYATQQVVESALDDCVALRQPHGANVVVMSAHDGAILAMACRPTFDPGALSHAQGQPFDVGQLLNRPVSLAMEPGSTFKLLSIAAALDAGVISEHSVFHCGGTEIIGDRPLKCWGPWATRGHGSLTPCGILENSCNLGAAKVALLLGKDRLCAFLARCGIGQLPGAGFPAEATGKLRSPEVLKVRDLANMGFGHNIQVSDLQMAAAVCAIMNGGVYYQPHIVQGYRNSVTGEAYETTPVAVRRVCSEHTSQLMRQFSRSVVDHGTGKAARIAGVAVGGKTATAQIFENGHALEGPHDYVMAFTLIAPVDRTPDFVVTVTVDRPHIGEHGADVAAPVARAIAQYLLTQPGLFREPPHAPPQARPKSGERAA